MTSPGQAVIFQSVGDGDLPFTSPLTKNSSTPLLRLSFCFLLIEEMKIWKGNKEKKEKPGTEAKNQE